jgi:hypothetical protein
MVTPNGEEEAMIKVIMEVGTYATCLTVSVLAESIIEAVSTAKEAYPGKEIRVVFPINSEEFFVRDAGAAHLIELDRPVEALRGSADIWQPGGKRE